LGQSGNRVAVEGLGDPKGGVEQALVAVASLPRLFGEVIGTENDPIGTYNGVVAEGLIS